MTLSPDILERITAALDAGRFAARGAVITDLDGTAVHQEGDRVMIAAPVQHGLELVRERGRPVIINTLRFPLSVMRTFGFQWAAWTAKPLPCVTLNGSLIGDVVGAGDGSLAFMERQAFPLAAAEVAEVVDGLDTALAAGVDRFTLFIYPRDAAAGEILWTPRGERIAALAEKYVSAAQVHSTTVDQLRRDLAGRDICMLAVYVEDPADRRLAFQHARTSGVVTRSGIDKRAGAHWLCERLGVDLAASLGAGDTEFDTFLDGVGLAVHVGTLDLAFRGVHDTLRLPDPFAFGEVLAEVARHCAQSVPQKAEVP